MIDSSPLPLILTMAGAHSKANPFFLPIEDHIETLHDDGPHHCPSARLGHSKFIAVLLGWRHIFYWPQVLLNRNREKDQREGLDLEHHKKEDALILLTFTVTLQLHESNKKTESSNWMEKSRTVAHWKIRRKNVLQFVFGHFYVHYWLIWD